jgi:N-acetylglucosamine kinase-like BadF-type ATPase
MKIYVGLDCGGSKTVAIAAEKDGKIIGRGIAGAANPLSVGPIRTAENIISAINNAVHGIKKPDFGKIYIGMAGGKPQMLKEIKKRLKLSMELHTADEIEVDHDLRIALYSGLPEGDGIVLIAGTGSAAWGVGKDGKEVLVSGWNHILGETGGYEMGIKAIIAATRFYDGRGEKTVLLEKIIETYQLNTIEDVSIVIRNSTDSPRIASLAPDVIEAAHEGDKVAIKILEEMIDEMDISIKAAATRAEIEKDLNVVLVGGMFNIDYPVLDKLTAKVQKWMNKVAFVRPKEEPARTALKFALKD